jgi:SAM-dependent methyltransferase
MPAFSDARQTWDRRFAAADGFLFGEAPNAWLAAQAGRLRPGMRALSVADGEGRNAAWLAGRGCEVTSFDVSPVGVERARALFAQRGVAVDARVCDVAEWAWEQGAFDLVAAIFIQFAPPALRERVFAGIARTLRPGGLLVLEGYGLRQLEYRTGGPGIAEHLYTMPMLLQAFPGWRIEASRDVDLELAEGAGHCGRSHVLSMVLRAPSG